MPASTNENLSDDEKSVAEAESVEDLKVSQAFTGIKLSLLLGGNAPTAALTESMMSQEACIMKQAIEEVTESLETIGNMFCHLDVESDLVEFNKKIGIMVDGAEFARLLIDAKNIKNGKIGLSFCMNEGGSQHRQYI